jgi:hypothetical protein
VAGPHHPRSGAVASGLAAPLDPEPGVPRDRRSRSAPPVLRRGAGHRIERRGGPPARVLQRSVPTGLHRER